MAMRWKIRRVSRHASIVPDFPDPDDPSECRGWEPQVAVFALSRRVLVVANTRIEGRWKAYIDAVPGEDHDKEWQDVRRHGGTVPHEIARVMFLAFADIPYAN